VRIRPSVAAAQHARRPVGALLFAAAGLALTGTVALASSAVTGTVTEFKSPRGSSEQCVALDHVPGGNYSQADVAKEREFCSIDLHGDTHALCPKVFSTSPGTLIFDLSGGAYAGDPARFEREACAGGGVHKRGASGDPISFKMSVNTRESSATFANASLVYYHFSRYFDASVHVPVAVLRTIDRQEHAARVSNRGVSLSAGKAALKMNHAAWLALQAAEKNPSSYKPTAELFTPDGQLYGAMLHPQGRRYGEEINGTRASGWGDGQNRDFQQTAPFSALRSSRPLAEAITEGKAQAMRDPKLAKATGTTATAEQMVFWMSDLVDITLLDYIFSQQDRIGNVDYVPYWYWKQDGKLERMRAQTREAPADIADRDPAYIRRTELGDNDAGLRLTYTNYTKRTGMLESLRHYRAETYRRLIALERDFAAKGPLYEYVSTTFGLSDREFAQVVENTAQAAAILRASCKAGRLRFDVEPEEFLLTGKVVERRLDCEEP
jgi:hypothetical protein